MDNHNDRKDLKITDQFRDLGLYIHIPFCVKKCDYCDFLSAPATEEIKRKYFEAIQTEIESYQGKTEGYVVSTIFFGGGTPSSVDAIYISEIMETIEEVFHVERNRLEATIEVNPGTITKEKLELYKAAGINRLSFGLQSADNQELFLLGRIHSYEHFVENYLLAREMGFENINIDLMSALPGQTLKSWENTLHSVVNLKPEHISAYSLIIEEGTKFHDRYYKSSKFHEELPDEDTDRLIYHRTKEILEENEYHRYEISNYAREGYECRHNSSYWIGIDYLGIGLGASSLHSNTRFKNLDDIKQYIHSCEEYKTSIFKENSEKPISNFDGILDKDPIGIQRDIEHLSMEQRMEEFMYLGLRLCKGISKDDFLHRFHTEIDAVYGKVMRQLIQKKLLVMDDDKIYLTEYGIDISNSVLAEFLLN